MKIYNALLIGLAALLLFGCTGTNQQGNNGTTAQNGSGPVKFADSADWSYAYLISGDNLDANATAALVGFQLQKNSLADGSINITLKAQSSEYTDQSYVVKPGQKLYFIERTLRDDQDGERNLHDDQAVVVDANGFVVQQ